MTLCLSTARLSLRPLRESDVDWCVDMLCDVDVARYLYSGEKPTERDIRAEMPLAVRRCAGGGIGIWAIEMEREVGTVFLLPLPVNEPDTNWQLIGGDALPDAEIELGFILRRSAWRCGIATEAARRLIQFAFEQTAIKELVAVTDADNLAAKNVLLKCGFTDQGMRRAYAERCPGFRLTRSDWRLSR